nr:ORF3 [Streptococcus pneumoniae]
MLIELGKSPISAKNEVNLLIIKNASYQARKFHEVNYSQKAEQQAKTPKKGGKKQAPASNVPKWSNPDYVNELDPKIVDMLVEFHKSQGTLETPEAQAEIAQKREEIEQRRAELEGKKQELLNRLNK